MLVIAINATHKNLVSMEALRCFDDSLFEAKKENATDDRLRSYNAKFCEPEEALKWYTDCIRVAPAANGVVRRDMVEGRARCWVKLGCYKKALKDVASLRADATCEMHIISALGLSVDIYRQSGNRRAELFDLVQLISLNSTSPWLWVHLAHVYQNLSQESPCRYKQNENLAKGNSTRRVDLHMGLVRNCDDRVSANLGDQVPAPHLEGDSQKLVKVGNKLSGQLCFQNSFEDSDIWLEYRNNEPGPVDQWRLFAYACVVRVKLLLRQIEQSQASFVLDKNLELQKEVEAMLMQSTMCMCARTAVGKVMSMDLGWQKESKDIDATETVPKPCSVREFHLKWFQKLLPLGNRCSVCNMELDMNSKHQHFDHQ
uniref:uncharacterized protein C8orf76 homolog isoform X2 n=1 Tax=Myxine glutinosa TaxID=7769 RepID=UPI00358FEC5B